MFELPFEVKVALEHLTDTLTTETDRTLHVLAQSMFDAGVIFGQCQVLRRLDPETAGIIAAELKTKEVSGDGD